MGNLECAIPSCGGLIGNLVDDPIPTNPTNDNQMQTLLKRMDQFDRTLAAIDQKLTTPPPPNPLPVQLDPPCECGSSNDQDK